MNIKLRCFFALLLCILASSCSAPTTKTIEPDDASVALEAKKQREFALKEIVRNHKRLHNVSWPILKAGLPLCLDRTRQSIGIDIINKFNVDESMRDAATEIYGLGENIQIISLAQNSPASTAGMKEGDIIISINGQSTPVGEKASQKFIQMLREIGEETNKFVFRINRSNSNAMIEMVSDKICDYPTIVNNNNEVNAYADGNNIVINQGMMDFTRNDDELSIVIAHELAHNNMRHIDAKKTNYAIGMVLDVLFAGLTGVDIGIRNATGNAYSKEFEAEADYVGMYILSRANVDTSDAPNFWRRMGIKHPGAIEENYTASHPSTPERFVAIDETIKEINRKKDAGIELMPNIDEEKRQSRDAPPSRAEELGFK